jgi:urease beta subunit
MTEQGIKDPCPEYHVALNDDGDGRLVQVGGHFHLFRALHRIASGGEV